MTRCTAAPGPAPEWGGWPLQGLLEINTPRMLKQATLGFFHANLLTPVELGEWEGYGPGNWGRVWDVAQKLGEREGYGCESWGRGRLMVLENGRTERGIWPWEPSPALVQTLPLALDLQPGKVALQAREELQGYLIPFPQLPLPHRARAHAPGGPKEVTDQEHNNEGGPRLLRASNICSCGKHCSEPSSPVTETLGSKH